MNSAVATGLGWRAPFMYEASRSGSARPFSGETGPFRRPELVEVVRMDRTLRLDVRYATSDNFLGLAVYPEARVFLQRPAAEALVRVNARMEPHGFGLLLFDGYRPWSVTRLFWEATNEDQHRFLADPREGSRHNRGCAVDLSLYDRATGQRVVMPSDYDEMSERAHPEYPGGTEAERRHRDLLRHAMESEGFSVHPREWWHFDHGTWREYTILDLPFSELGA
ncbi:MAG TPA: M15 family metallopeptidase [Methylococcus sp.]|nr:M15 family metallopeptidase [Methylococcus sp.]